MKPLFFKALSAFSGFLVAYALLELFLRMNPTFGYIQYSFKLLSKEATIVKDMDELYLRPSQLFGYEPIPNEGGFNSFGLRGKEYSLRKENVFRILLLGDSIGWIDWSRQFLEEKLNSTPLLNLNYKFEIWNASVPGYDVRHYYLYLKHKGLNYNPDMVIIFFCMNDFNIDTNIYYKTKDGSMAYDFSPRRAIKKYAINTFLLAKSYLYRFVILKLDRYLYREKQGVNTDKENGKFYLGLIKEICAKNKILLFTVIFPYLKPLDQYKDYELSQYESICNVAKALNVASINLYTHFSPERLYGLRHDEKDAMHPSYEGHRLIAQIIYNYLITTNIFYQQKT